jgi:predicted esterase
VREHRLTTSRRARFYTWGGDDTAGEEVWIVCHGFGQLAAEFSKPFDRIASRQRLIVAPEALNRFYVDLGEAGSHTSARVGTTWMTREDRLNEIADYVEFLDAVYATTVPPEARVTALGFSQGVATVARWITMGNAHVHRFIAWTGQLPPDLDFAKFGVRLAGGRLVLVQGETDRFAQWVREDENQARLHAAGITFESITFSGGHRLDDEVLQRLANG